MKRIIILVIILILVVFGFAAIGQVKTDIVTDRPDQTEAPVLVPKGGLQIETGFFLSTNEINRSK